LIRANKVLTEPFCAAYSGKEEAPSSTPENGSPKALNKGKAAPKPRAAIIFRNLRKNNLKVLDKSITFEYNIVIGGMIVA